MTRHEEGHQPVQECLAGRVVREESVSVDVVEAAVLWEGGATNTTVRITDILDVYYRVSQKKLGTLGKSKL